MGGTTMTNRNRRFLVAVAAAATLSVLVPTGTALAAEPRSTAAVPALTPPDQGGGSAGGGNAGGGSAGGGSAGGSGGSGGNSGGNPAPGGSSGGGAQPDNGAAERAAADRADQARESAQRAQAEEQQQARENAAEQQAKEEAQDQKAEQKAAAAAAKAQQKAAEKAAKAAAQAARAAAQLAAANQRARVSWDSHARPDKMVIVRSRTIDMVSNGSLTRQVPRREGSLTLSILDRYLPNEWLTITDGTARLSAAVILSPGVSMDVGGDVKAVQLTGGADATDASSIYTGSGRLIVHDVAVSSVDPGSQQAMPIGPGRPFIVVSSGGRFESTDATLSDLGTPPDPDDRPGVLFNSEAKGSMVRTTLLRNSTGLKLDRTDNVRLEAVTVKESVADGLVLRGDRGTTLIGINAENNAGSGVLVTGESSGRPITGITTTGNGGFGVSAVGQVAPQINGIVSTADGAGGLRVSRSTDVKVTDFQAVDQPIGVLTHAGSSGLALDNVRITGGARGLVVDKSASKVALTASTIEGAQAVAVGIAGKDVDLNNVGLKDSGTGVRIERGAGDITANGLSISGGKDGVIATPGSTGLVLQNLVTNGVTSTAVRTFSPDTRIMASRITGSSTGIDAGVAATITDTAITQVDEGIRARSTELVHADNVDVNAIESGINVAEGSPFLLTNSRIDALEAVHGVVQQQGLNELSLPPLNLLGAIGVPLIILALLLEQLQAFRQRSVGSVRRRLPPSLPAGAG